MEFRKTFFWHYLRHSFLKEWGTLVFMVAFFGILYGSRIGIPVVLGILAVLLGGILLSNYLAWRTIGRLLSSKAERDALSADELAKLAWSFWWRPARKSKH